MGAVGENRLAKDLAFHARFENPPERVNLLQSPQGLVLQLFTKTFDSNCRAPLK
jgi:hypothetical protein